jgi:hypothetical protein
MVHVACRAFKPRLATSQSQEVNSWSELHIQESYIAANMAMAILRDADEAVIAALKSKLQNCSTSLPEKYRILFSLRNLKGPAAHDALQTGALYATECSCYSSLTVAKRVHILLDPAHFCSGCACSLPRKHINTCMHHRS